MLLGQELKFKNKLCNLKLGTFFSALPGLGASALSGRVEPACESSVQKKKNIPLEKAGWGIVSYFFLSPLYTRKATITTARAKMM